MSTSRLLVRPLIWVSRSDRCRNLEAALFNAGALTWNDSGNHKRYGQRDPASGQIVYAFGVDLTPLAYLREELQQKLDEKKLHDAAWMETKRQISWYRRQMRGLLAEWEMEVGAEEGALRSLERRYDEIAVQIRTHLGLKSLRALLAHHKALHGELVDRSGLRTLNP